MDRRENDSAVSYDDFDQLLIDGHVHFHECYDEARFFEAACANLSRQGRGTPTLLLTEMAGQNVFERWRKGSAAWPVTVTEEPESLLLGGKLLIIAGRQILSAERIEVLALVCMAEIADGLPVGATIGAVRKAEAVPVLPWGVGKWFGKRGRLVAKTAELDRVLLGDNAGRPQGWPRPPLFREHVMLAGTDPFPLPREAKRVGTFGFVLDGRVDLRQPGRAIARALQNLTESPTRFGHRIGPIDFLRQQVALRLAR